MYEELGTSTRNKHDTIVKKDTAKLKSRLSQDLSSNAAKHRWMRSSTTYTSNRSRSRSRSDVVQRQARERSDSRENLQHVVDSPEGTGHITPSHTGVALVLAGADSNLRPHQLP